MANRTVTQLTAVLQMNNSKFKKGLTGSQKALKAFQKQVSMVGGMIAGAFTIQAVASFTQESLKLAMQLEGVARAFDRIKPSVDFMDELKAATHGTVSELELMKRAVMASNFKIPLEQMAALLGFATKRAQDTGESVDYLVESIVLGIGRKSIKILDNLGISAVELKEKLNGVSTESASVAEVSAAVADIASEAMAKTGAIVDTVSVKFERLKAGIKDASAEFGKFLMGQTEADQKLRTFADKTLWVWAGFLEGGMLDVETASTQLNKAIAISNGEFETLRDLTQSIDLKNLFPTSFDGGFLVTGLWGLNDAITELIEKEKAIKAQWEKNNDAIKAKITLQEQLTDAINATTFAQLEQLRQIAKAYADQKAKEKADADAKRDAKNAILDNQHYGDYLTQPDEVWGGGAEPWGAGIDTTAIADATAKMKEAEQAAKDFGETFEAMLEMGLAKGVSDLFAGIGEAFVSGNMDGAFLSILESVGKFMVQMGSMFVAYGIAASAFFAAITAGPYGAVAAIAAGAALAAIGGAIIGTAKNMSSTGSSSTGGVSSQGSWGHDVRFKIQGKDLVGALSRYNDTNFLNT